MPRIIHDMQLKYITNETGEKTTVILPIEEFEELLERRDEQSWQNSFAVSQDLLEKMADKAMQVHKQGKTSPLDLSDL